MKNLLSLNHYFVKYKWHLILGILFVSASNYFGILIPQEIRKALDMVQSKILEYKALEGVAQSEFYSTVGSTLMVFGLIVTGYVIVKGVLMYFMRQTIIVMSRLIEYDMRKSIFDHLQLMDQEFYKTRQTGDIMSRVAEDVSKVRNYLGPGILYAINLVSLFIFTIYAMISVSPYLTFWVLLPLPILSISIYFVSNTINKKSTAIQEQLAALNATAQESYSGIRVVKSYVQESSFFKYFTAQSEEYKKRALSLAMTEAWFQPLMILLIALSTLIVVFVGAKEYNAGNLSAGNIAEFILYVNMLTWPVTAIGWIASVVQEAEASQKRINELLDIKPNISNTSLLDKNHVIEGDIEFKNVTFIYPNTGVKALDNINFKLQKGERLAILGRTGSGKSTIAELLTRMYDVTSGEILIDGINIKAHHLDAVRNNIAVVPQDVFLFSDTIRNNIGFSDANLPLEKIVTYADKASIKEEIEKFPEQFDTVVGERGVTLSGGQKQRISIARAFIKNPEIVILDDALSAVDTTTERQILQFFEEEMNGKTAIIITHRANNLLNYDKIIVLDNGKIIETGTHDELLQNNNFYASIFQQQNKFQPLVQN